MADLFLAFASHCLLGRKDTPDIYLRLAAISTHETDLNGYEIGKEYFLGSVVALRGQSNRATVRARSGAERAFYV